MNLRARSSNVLKRMFLHALFSAFPFSFGQLFYAISFIFSLNSLLLKASAFSSIARRFYIFTLVIIKMLLRNVTDEKWVSDNDRERKNRYNKKRIRNSELYEESCTTKPVGGRERAAI